MMRARKHLELTVETIHGLTFPASASGDTKSNRKVACVPDPTPVAVPTGPFSKPVGGCVHPPDPSRPALDPVRKPAVTPTPIKPNIDPAKRGT